MPISNIRRNLLVSLAVFVGSLALCQTLTLSPAHALGTSDIQSSVISSLVDESTTGIASGISQKCITYVNSSSNRVECFEVDVDLKSSSVSLAVGTPNDGAVSGMQTVRAQADATIADGKNVVTAVNGDFYNMATGEPDGCVIKDGVEIHSSNGSAFFGITNEGSAVIGDDATYQQTKNDLKQAMSSNALLVKDGVVVGSSTDLEPRTAVGIRADGSVFFIVIDGRQDPYSAGITLTDLAKLMLDMGAVQAANLDGGGSSTYTARIPGSDALSVLNSPSDGTERTVASSWLIVSNAVVDHTFSTASVTPADASYAPEAVVDFVAQGLDSSGASAPLPATGLTWSLSDTSFGTIDADTGVFTSNGKLGQVQAQVSYNGKIAGSAYVEIAVPDDIHFTQTELSLKFDTDQDLGLVVRYQGRDITVHSGDIKWTFDPSLGTMGDDNVFHTATSGASGTVTAQFTGTTLSATLNLKVGQLPVVMYDFEDGLENWSTSTANRGEKSSISLATYPNDPVRFGTHSLRIDFDFTNGLTKTTLGAYAGPAVSTAIPGTPTAIGMWVYATPEAQGYWLRMYIYDKNGTAQPINLTTQSQGINWTGWKYIEAAIPSTYQGPFTSFPKQMIRLMSLKSGTVGGGPMTKGTIYVDNIRAVYGSNVDDLTPPIVDSVNVDGKTYTNASVNVSASIRDDMSDPYATGIDWSRAKILVDGKDYSTDASHFSYDMDGTLNLSGISWPDGVHKVTIDIQDNFGNETTKDAYFTVNTGTGTTVQLQQGAASASLGSTYEINLTTNDSADIKSITTTIHVDSSFPVSGVDFSADASGSTYAYDVSSGTLTLNVVNSSATASTATLATIDVSIPSSTTQGSKLDYDVLSSSIQYTQGKGGSFGASFFSLPASIPIVSAYQVTVQSAIVGQDGTVLVTDDDGNPVQGATVTMTVGGGQPQQLGVTDQNGLLSSSSMTQSAQKFTLTAEKGGGCSFPIQAQAYSPVLTATPSDLLTGATQDATTEKRVTWMTNPLLGEKTAVMQVATKDAYTQSGEQAFQDFMGNEQVLTYDSDSSAVTLNSALATGLKPGTAYVFRVGDGTNWSDVRSFTTLTDTSQFTFDVFGDTQVTDVSGLSDFSKMLTAIEDSSTLPSFSIHVGDFTDDQTVFNEMGITAAMFSQHPVFDSIDMIHVLGNHEHMGDDGTKSAAILGLPDTDGPAVDKVGNYSVDYGNMHIAVIDWTDNADTMAKEMDWLRQDMAATTQTWKVIAVHQPTYNKNPADTGSTLFLDMLAPVCDELGIDIVFNGHDHSYGRTYPLINSQNTTGGTVYIAAGHTGDKTYDILPDNASVWAFVQQDKNDKVYLTCTVDGNKLHLTATRADGSVMDQADLTSHNADKAALTAAVAANIGKSDSNYTQASWNAFQATLTNAQTVLNTSSVTQADVDAAAQALADTVAALETNVADKTALTALIANASTLDSNDYTPGSWAAFQEVLTGAQTVLNVAAAPQTQVDSTFSALSAVKDALVFKANKELLAQALTLANGTDTTNCKPGLVNTLDEAIASATTVMDDVDATQADVDSAVTSLMNSMNNLQQIVDNTRLTALISSVGSLTEAKYTAESWSAVQVALTAANTCAADQNAYEDDITKAYNDLAGAVAGLVSRANKASLTTVINLAQGVIDNIDGYCPATVEGLDTTLTQAKMVLNQDDATQAQVDSAASSLLTVTAKARVKADKKVLSALVARVASLDISQYQSEGVAVLDQSLAQAKTVMADENVIQADVDAVAQSLSDATAGLVALVSGDATSGGKGSSAGSGSGTSSTSSTPVVDSETGTAPIADASSSSNTMGVSSTSSTADTSAANTETGTTPAQTQTSTSTPVAGTNTSSALLAGVLVLIVVAAILATAFILTRKRGR